MTTTRFATVLLCVGVLGPARQALADEPGGDAIGHCAEPAESPPEIRQASAAEHYHRGQELYAQGEYERAIPLFHAAYCLVPAPEPVYNIAQAYERLVDYTQAVSWFELYLRVLPETSRDERDSVTHRLTALRRLPARIRVATDPPGAEIVLHGPDGEIRGRANADPLRVSAGSYTMRVTMADHEPIVEEVAAEIGQPYTFSYRLAPQTGLVRIATDPENARIFLDQKLVAVGDFADRVPVGEHLVTVEAEGRPPRTVGFVVARDRVSPVYVILPERPTNGRTELLVGSTAFGLVAGGALSSTLFDERASRLAAVFIGAGGAIGFGGPYLGLPERVPVGTSSFLVGSALWGAAEGIGFAFAWSKDDRAVPAALGGGAAATFVAALAAGPLDLSAGDAALLNSGALWGCAAGTLTWSALGQEERWFGPLLLVGLNTGLLAGAAIASRTAPSRGHVAVVDVAGFVGALLGNVLSSAFEDVGQPRRRDHFTLGGAATGLVLGTFLTRHMDERALPLAPALSVATAPDGALVTVYGVSAAF